MGLPQNDVYFDEMTSDELREDTVCGLYHGHIPTTKEDIESLVETFYSAMQRGTLQSMITELSQLNPPPILDIRELYETDQNEFDDELEEITNPGPMSTGSYEYNGVNPMEMSIQQMREMNHIKSEHDGQSVFVFSCTLFFCIGYFDGVLFV